MKIMHVCKKYPDALGGDATVVASLEKIQLEKGHSTVILTSNCEDIINDSHIYKYGIKDTPAGLDSISIKRILSLLILLIKSHKIIRAEKPDIIHTHSIDMAFIVSFAARRFHIPMVHTFHIVTFNDKRQSFLRRKSEIALLKLTRASLITAPNSYEVGSLEEMGFSNVVLLPNGINLEDWRGKNENQNKIFTFCSVGRIEEQKGFEYLIDAVKLINDKYDIPFELLIAGDGSLKNHLISRVVTLGIESKVKFLGRKSQANIRTLYSKSNAIVIASLWETTPLTLLEAWAMKIPVVSTDVGILRNEKNYRVAIIAKNGDAKSLANAMLKAMRDNESAVKVARTAYEEVRLIYTWKRIEGLLEIIYKKAMI